MSTKKFKKSLFIFRRDLRLEDNTGLIKALQESATVIPVFIFDPAQVEAKSNKYRSSNALQFMIDSLVDLDCQLVQKKARLHIFYGNPTDTVRYLIEKEKIDAVFTNRDYTPFSKYRDEKIENLCTKNGIEFKSYHDILLNPPSEALKKDGHPYTIFTPFFKNCIQKEVALAQKNSYSNFYAKKIAKTVKPEQIAKKIMPKGNSATIPGGRKNALKILKNIIGFKNYKVEHDIPAINGTTKLSAHNKFGTISIREVYHAIVKNLGKGHPLVRQLYWRDFFTHIAYNFPKVFGHAFSDKYDSIKWSHDTKKFNAWCEGKTGFPIVDAGMRELNATGFMHNRVRMITASFLVKDLHIDWREGERYFATKLVDYDPCVNNGNWQWSASTGCDHQPYFRIFNPWIQQKKFDAQCLYIKKWVPELKSLSPREIHKLFKTTKTIKAYPTPIIDHKKESNFAIVSFKKLV